MMQKEAKLKELDQKQFLLFCKWFYYVRPQAKHEVLQESYNFFEPFEEWEWSLLEYDLEHKQRFHDWCKAKIELYEFDPSLAKRDAGHLIALQHRMPPEFQDRVFNLLFQ
jgi:hypothetical protein